MLAKPIRGNLAWEPLPENLACLPGNPCMGLACDLFLGTLLGNLLLGTLAWEPLPGNLATAAACQDSFFESEIF